MGKFTTKEKETKNDQITKKKRHIGIGLCAPTTILTRLPGWDPNSYGYHADDGY